MTRRAPLLAAALAFASLASLSRALPAARRGGPTGLQPLRVEVVEARSGEPLPARVVVRGPDGRPVKSEYEQLPGVFTGEDGALELPLAPGRYSVEAHHGIDHVSRTLDVVVPRAQGPLRIALEPWVPLRELGWANGDAHAHLYSDTKRDEAMAATVRRICRAQGVDFLFACQTWAGYGDADWRAGFAKVSDARFRLFFGAEMPKYRTGHTFWIGLQSTRGAFDGAMDTSFEERYHLVAENPRWTFDLVPFPNVPDLELVSRFREAEDALAILPHPTSWWWQRRDGVEKYVTNVASSLPAGLLAGRIWDGMVVMGYDHDPLFYQDLWFHALDAGWRLVPFGELDGGFPPSGRFWYGSTRSYLQVGALTTREAILRAARAGHAFVTSGPIVLASIEAGHGRARRSFQPGDVVPADGRARTLRVQAYASGDRDERLSYVVLFRNSRLHKVWDLRLRAAREFADRLELRETGPAWYALKVYGRTSRTPGQLDVRAEVERLTRGAYEGKWPGDSEVAIASPFYFRVPGTAAEPAPLVSHVRLRLVDPASGEPVTDAVVTVQLAGRVVASVSAPAGVAELRAPAQAVLRLDAPGRPTLRRTLYLDSPRQRERVERLASGRWLDAFGGRARMQPGQVPWEAFELEGTRRDLSEVEWTIPWSPNERDPAWEAFDRRFR
jgi:hypothetical protein